MSLTFEYIHIPVHVPFHKSMFIQALDVTHSHPCYVTTVIRKYSRAILLIVNHVVYIGYLLDIGPDVCKMGIANGLTCS